MRLQFDTPRNWITAFVSIGILTSESCAIQFVIIELVQIPIRAVMSVAFALLSTASLEVIA
jgi:hypothetical protein